MNKPSDLLSRIRRLRVSPRELGIEAELALLMESYSRGSTDAYLLRIVEERIVELEASLQQQPLLGPSSAVSLGRHEILNTASGKPVRISFGNGMNRITHITVFGRSGSGKSFFLSQLASSTANECHSVIIDSNNSFRGTLAGIHQFIRWEDLRSNPYDVPPALQWFQAYSMFHSELCRAYSLQFAEYVLVEIVNELRAKGKKPNLPMVLQALKDKKYQGWSNRVRYRDSAVLVLNNLIASTGEMFNCSEGMSLFEMMEDNVVIELGGLVAQHQGFLIRYLFEYLSLLSRCGRRVSRPLLFMLDEGQSIAAQSDLASKILQLRHSGIHLVANFQNAALAGVEVVGNSDMIVAFQCVDGKDISRVMSVMGLSNEGANQLAQLEVGQCICYLPSSEWKHAFLAQVPRIESRSVDASTIRQRSSEFVRRFTWKPIEKEEIAVTKKLDSSSEALLRDVFNQAHEFSALTQRFERAGIRSACVQASVMKRLIGNGYIRTCPLAVGRGRPITLVEPSEKAFLEYKIEWKRNGKGSLPARAATEFLARKLRSLGWQVVLEGKVKDKRVDLLCRDTENGLITIEIAHSPGHEVHNALACLRESEVKAHFVVCTTKEVCGVVKRRFEEMGIKERVLVLTLAAALARDWMH